MDFKTKQVLLNMTRLKRFRIGILLICIGLINACTPDDDAGPTIPDSYTYTATINGTSWSGKQNLSVLIKDVSDSTNKEMRISANGDGRLLTLSLVDGSTGIVGDGIAVKTYSLHTGGTSSLSIQLVDTDQNKTYTGAYGQVVVTACDVGSKTITGTFNGTLFLSAGDSMVITNGTFSKLTYDISEQ